MINCRISISLNDALLKSLDFPGLGGYHPEISLGTKIIGGMRHDESSMSPLLAFCGCLLQLVIAACFSNVDNNLDRCSLRTSISRKAACVSKLSTRKYSSGGIAGGITIPKESKSFFCLACTSLYRAMYPLFSMYWPICPPCIL